MIVGVLLLTQFMLLWMAEIHWDEESFPLPTTTQSVQANDQRATPSDSNKNPCTVCLIVRQNAVRPSTGSPLPQPATAVYLQHAIQTVGIRSHLPSIAFGRAPPLV